MATIKKVESGRYAGQYRVRYVGLDGKEHSTHRKLEREAKAWLREQLAKIETGTWVDPKTAKMTMGAWLDRWEAGYATRKASTYRAGQTHVKVIREHFGGWRLDTIKPSDVKSWVVKLQREYADSTVYALHSRLGQVMADAVHDGVLPRSPVSRRTAPAAPKQRPYVATTKQVWALHEAIEDRYRAGVLLAAYAGLRVAEVCGLQVADVDFMRGIVSPLRQYPDEGLKTELSRTPIPVPTDLTLLLSAHVKEFSTDWLMTDPFGKQMGPWQIQRAFRAARATVRKSDKSLPEGFRFHDLRHYYASVLIAAGLDVKTVQTRMRHESAKTTLDTYGHMFPDTDDTTRTAIAAAMTVPVSGNDAESRKKSGNGKGAG